MKGALNLPSTGSCARNIRRSLWFPAPALAHTGAVTSRISANARQNKQYFGTNRARQYGSGTSSAASQSDASSTGSDVDADEAAAFANNIWEPVPPTPALGRKRKVALLVGCAMLEITLTGTMMWAPLLGAVLLAVLQPTKAEIAERQQKAVSKAVAAAELRMSRQLPVTPVESAAWMNRLNQQMWEAFWQPFLLANNLSMWQDAVASAAPRGWEAEISDVSIGSIAPELTNFQVFADASTGVVNAMECSMVFDSNSVRLVVVGKGPLGAFTARVSGVQMQGQLRILPLLQHRMLLVAFREQPEVRVSLTISAPLFRTLSPGDLGQLDFIQGLVGNAIKDMLVEPRRMAISLDADMKVEQAISTTLHLTVESITGLPAAALGPAGSTTGSTGGTTSPSGGRRPGGPRIALVAIDCTSQVRRSTGAVSPTAMHRAVLLRQGLSLDLPRKQGMFRLEARDMASRGSGGARGTLLGSCNLWVAAARDGTTLFWSHDRSAAPLATRWSPSDEPWRVTLPMTGTAPGFKGLEVTLGVSVEPWVYQQPRAGTVGRRTPGPRAVVLQVVEARGLSLPVGGAVPSGGPHAHIQLCYDQECYSTATQYNTNSPIYNETIAFQENPSMLTRRVRLEVWHNAPTPLDSSGSSTAADSHTTGSSSSRSKRRMLGKTSRALGLRSRDHSPGRLHHTIPQNRATHCSNGSAISQRSHLSNVSDQTDAESAAADRAADADVSSHMLVDVQLEDDQIVETEGHQVMRDGGSTSSSDGSSSSNSNGNGVSLGSTVINLDQLTENVIQDRWFALNGSDGAEVRLRMVLLPGTLPPAGSSSNLSRAAASAAAATGIGTGSSKDVSDMLSFFHRNLLGSSRESIMVEVVSARLYLPLSSMDSSDVDQPAYVLSYNGSSTITLPPHLQQQQQHRPMSPHGSSSSGDGSSSSSRVPSPAGGSSKRRSKRADKSVGSQRSLFDEVVAGNISAQVVMRSCLARAVFPLVDRSTALMVAAADGDGHLPAAADEGESPPSAAAAAAAAAGSQLKVLLFDPDDLLQTAPAAAAALPPDRAAAALSVAGGGSSSSSNTFSPQIEDIGRAEIDVMRMLSKAGASGSSAIATAAAAGSGSVAGSEATASAATAAATWEGWVRLDKDGGHVLVRLTQLAASQPADLVPPPSSSTAQASSTAAAAGVSPEASKVAAAAAAGRGTAAAAAAAAGTHVDQHDEDDDSGGVFSHRINDLLQRVAHETESQVAGVAGQLSNAAATAGGWISSGSSNIGGWLSSNIHLPSLPKLGGSSSSSSSKDAHNAPGSSSSSKDAHNAPGSSSSSGTSQQQQQRPFGSQKQVEEHEENTAKHERGTAAESAVAAADVEAHELVPPRPPSSVDLRHIAKAWGWGAQQQQQQQRGQQQQQQQQGWHWGFPPTDAAHQQQQQQQEMHKGQVLPPGQQQQQDPAVPAAHQHANVNSIMAIIDDVIQHSSKDTRRLLAGSWQQQQQPEQQQQPAEPHGKQLLQAEDDVQASIVLHLPNDDGDADIKPQHSSSSSSSSGDGSSSSSSGGQPAGLPHEPLSPCNETAMQAGSSGNNSSSNNGSSSSSSCTSSSNNNNNSSGVVGDKASSLTRQATTATDGSSTAAAAGDSSTGAGRFDNISNSGSSGSSNATAVKQTATALQQQQQQPGCAAAASAPATTDASTKFSTNTAAAATAAAAAATWPPLGSHPLAADAWSHYSYDGDAQEPQAQNWEGGSEEEEF